MSRSTLEPPKAKAIGRTVFPYTPPAGTDCREQMIEMGFYISHTTCGSVTCWRKYRIDEGARNVRVGYTTGDGWFAQLTTPDTVLIMTGYPDAITAYTAWQLAGGFDREQ